MPLRVRRMNLRAGIDFSLAILLRRIGFAHLEAGILKLLADLFRRKDIEAERAQTAKTTGERINSAARDHCFHVWKASAKAFSPGVPFSSARMARRLLP